MLALATPLVLILLPLPFLALKFLPPMRGGSGALHVPSSILSGADSSAKSGLAMAGQKILPGILWIALVIALAGPRYVVAGAALPANGRDIVLALDLSGSMEAKDFELNGLPSSRLDAVKTVAIDFVRGRSGDRVALVIFAENAYFATPLTYDVEAVAQSIEAATIGISGRSTAISDGLGLALKRLSSSPSPSRIVVLLSDGVNTSGNVDPLGAADLALELGIKVHTIALGVHETGDGSPIRDAVDAETLRLVAERSGGTAFRVRSTADLRAVGASIDVMETSPDDLPETALYRDLWIFPALIALLAALSLHISARERA